MKSLNCLFRHNVRIDSGAESAQCRLLEQMIGRVSPDDFRISRSACEVCLEHAAGDALASHPVLPSLLLQICECSLSEITTSASESEDARPLKETAGIKRMLDTAIRTLAKQENRPARDALPSCDVIVCAHESTSMLRQSIVSILEQQDVVPFLHLIDTGDASAVFSEFAGCWNVRWHRQPRRTTALAALHALVESLSTPYVAIQAAHSISAPNRLAKAIRILDSTGSEFFVSNCDRMFESESPPADSEYCRVAHPGTFVFRRCSFVDMGGVADVPDDDIELLFRARCEGRRLASSAESLVYLERDVSLPASSSLPEYPRDGHSLRSYGNGFPRVPVSCDVVLPFHGHLDFVEQALQSLLEQEECEPVIHLIDDASPGATNEFLRTWRNCPNVRIYRNLENIGQFQSFNNVCRYFETPLCAVQDADDLSLPHRLSWSGQMLHYGGADVFAAAVELFGDDQLIRPMHQGPLERRQRVSRASLRRSFYPVRGQHGYFLENPTTMFRTSTFQALGGFADFGDRLMNRASVDTELQQRLLYHGVRIAVSREIVLRYRVHGNSATQNMDSGWGTEARNKSGQIVDARVAIFERGGFDPKCFGSLGRHQHLTIPVS